MMARATRMLRPAALLACLLALGGCSSLGNMMPWGGSSRPKPAELGPNVPVLGVRQAWTSQIGSTQGVALDVRVVDGTVLLASAGGEVVALNAATGADVWRTRLGVPLASGVGSDGRWTAVTAKTGELIALEGGREIWRKPLPAQAYTAPLVAGERIFVLAADRSVQALTPPRATSCGASSARASL